MLVNIKRPFSLFPIKKKDPNFRQVILFYFLWKPSTESKELNALTVLFQSKQPDEMMLFP